MIDKKPRKGPWSRKGLYSAQYNMDCACGCSPADEPNPVQKLTWKNMLRRCYYENEPSYFRYGGRGIDVCQRLMNAYCFSFHVGPRPEIVYPETGHPVYSLGRINPNGGYWCGTCSECQELNRPSNVEWQSAEDQNSPEHRLPHHTHIKKYRNKRQLAKDLGPAGRRRAKFLDQCNIDLIDVYENCSDAIKKTVRLRLVGLTYQQIADVDGTIHQTPHMRILKLRDSRFSITRKLRISKCTKHMESAKVRNIK